jgi:membrane protease YdiL (CAAX protease family)
MEPEVEPSQFPSPTLQPASEIASAVVPPEPPEAPYRGLRWIFIGDDGLRAGWSVAIFFALMIPFVFAFGTLFNKLHLTGGKGDFSAKTAFFGEGGAFLAMVLAAWIVSKIERRKLFDYNLTGPHRVARFSGGLVAGFVALSALISGLYAGGWLHFGPVALSGTSILTNAALWGAAFFLVGCVEEGVMRCFLLFTLARGINFWWALGLVGLMCGDLMIRAKGNGVWGVYGLAILGLVPCVALFVKNARGAGFWYATWVTSTFFGYGHTGNNGENWIGIFAAGGIGAVFCVSVKVTGSAWWAIGCHAAWDWAETYFYGTADSGMAAQGHLLTSAPAGAALWSGGADGPEGSLLVIGVVLLLLLAMLAVYGRRKPVVTFDAQALERAAG